MAKFPEPPGVEALRRIGADTVQLPSGVELSRVYFAGPPHPSSWQRFRTFGPLSGGRFDHHAPPPHLQPRGILFAALDGATAVAEAFQATRTVDTTVRAPFLAQFCLRKTVAVLDLTGSWPTRAGCRQAIASGRRDRAQRWSRQIYDAYAGIVGVLYPSSMLGGGKAVAFYERARTALAAFPEVNLPLAHPALRLPLERVAAALTYVVV